MRRVIRALRMQVGVQQVGQLHAEVPLFINVHNHAARQTQATAEDDGQADENGNAAQEHRWPLRKTGKRIGAARSGQMHTMNRRRRAGGALIVDSGVLGRHLPAASVAIPLP